MPRYYEKQLVVSVAEFITVRFQQKKGFKVEIVHEVSVAEFITVRFQQLYPLG